MPAPRKNGSSVLLVTLVTDALDDDGARGGDALAVGSGARGAAGRPACADGVGAAGAGAAADGACEDAPDAAPAVCVEAERAAALAAAGQLPS